MDLYQSTRPVFHGAEARIFCIGLVEFEISTKLVDLSVNSIFQDQLREQLLDLIHADVDLAGKEVEFDSSVRLNL